MIELDDAKTLFSFDKDLEPTASATSYKAPKIN